MIIKATRHKFDIPFTIIDKGSGTFLAAFEDIDLSEGGTLDWVPPRRILKVPVALPVTGGMVITSPLGVEYMVAEHSPSETSQGNPFKAFKLFQVTSHLEMRRRSTTIDLRTGLPREGVLGPVTVIYASREPLQEAFDRELRIPNEKSRLVTNEPIVAGDIIDGETVIEAHAFRGLWGAVLG